MGSGDQTQAYAIISRSLLNRMDNQQPPGNLKKVFRVRHGYGGTNTSVASTLAVTSHRRHAPSLFPAASRPQPPGTGPPIPSLLLPFWHPYLSAPSRPPYPFLKASVRLPQVPELFQTPDSLLRSRLRFKIPGDSTLWCPWKDNVNQHSLLPCLHFLHLLAPASAAGFSFLLCPPLFAGK